MWQLVMKIATSLITKVDNTAPTIAQISI